MNNTLFERLFSLFLSGFGAWCVYTSLGFKSPVYPAVLGAIITVFSLIMFARTFRKMNEGTPEKEEKTKLSSEQINVIITILLTLCYVLLIKPAGFIVASVFFMCVLMFVLGFRRIWVSILISVPFVTALYLFFVKVVHISLPSGILPF